MRRREKARRMCLMWAKSFGCVFEKLRHLQRPPRPRGLGRWQPVQSCARCEAHQMLYSAGCVARPKRRLPDRDPEVENSFLQSIHLLEHAHIPTAIARCRRQPLPVLWRCFSPAQVELSMSCFGFQTRLPISRQAVYCDEGLFHACSVARSNIDHCNPSAQQSAAFNKGRAF